MHSLILLLRIFPTFSTSPRLLASIQLLASMFTVCSHCGLFFLLLPTLSHCWPIPNLSSGFVGSKGLLSYKDMGSFLSLADLDSWRIWGWHLGSRPTCCLHEALARDIELFGIYSYLTGANMSLHRNDTDAAKRLIEQAQMLGWRELCKNWEKRIAQS